MSQQQGQKKGGSGPNQGGQNKQQPKQPQQQQQQQQPKPQHQPQQQAPAPQSSSSSSTITPAQFAPVSLCTDIKLLPPLAPGTTNVLSKPAKVSTNSYSVNFDRTLLHSVYQYSVAFEPEVPSSHVKRKLFYNAALLCDNSALEWLAFDGQSMAYSFLPLPNQTIDTNQQMTQLINKKSLYDEFGVLLNQPPTGPSFQITITMTNKCHLGPALEQIQQSTSSLANITSAMGSVANPQQPQQGQLTSTDAVRAKNDLASFVNLSLSTLIRHLSVVLACHSERNRIRTIINKQADSAYWKSKPEVRIQLSIEGFIARNGCVFRLDRPAEYNENSKLGKAVYGVPAAFSALRFLQTGITFNVAQSCIPTYQLGQPVLKILEEIAGGDLSKAPETVYKQLLKYRAITNHLPSGKNTRVPLQEVGKRLKDCDPFIDDTTGKKVTVAQYFETRYKIKLNPNYYTYQIQKQSKARTDPQTGKVAPARTMTLVYPVEILTLYSANNNGVKDLDVGQTKSMLNLMTRRPHESLAAASTQLKQLELALKYVQQETMGSAAVGLSDAPEAVKAKYVGKSIYHAISFNSTPLTAEARVLPAPSAEFGGNQTIQAQAGEFKVRDFKLVEPASTQSKLGPIKAVVANLTYRMQDSMVSQYATKLLEVAGQRGLKITMDTNEKMYCDKSFNNSAARNLEQWARGIHQRGRDTHCTYVVIAVCDANSEFYNCLKRVGDSELALVSQCADSAKVQKTFGSFAGRPPNESAITSYVGNIVLKLNCKLGGLNYRLKSAKPEHNPIIYKSFSTTSVPHPTISATAPVAIFGIDIYHSPGSRSHAGVVGTWDKSCSKYNGYLIQQPKSKAGKAQSSQEVMDATTLQLAFTNLFLQFSAKQPSPSLPQQIIVYRDGLSESQIALAMDNEIPGIIAGAQQAYLTLFPKSTYTYNPTITFMIAVKRHQIFFQPQPGEDDPMGKDSRTFNVRAGSCIDVGIVRNDITEFYLQAHASALGTGKCTLYQVVYCSDPKSAKLDDLELLTNYLSYGLQRVAKSTRIPSPVSHADLVCYRGRCYAPPNSPDGTWKVDKMPDDLIGRHYWL